MKSLRKDQELHLFREKYPWFNGTSFKKLSIILPCRFPVQTFHTVSKLFSVYPSSSLEQQVNKFSRQRFCQTLQTFRSFSNNYHLQPFRSSFLQNVLENYESIGKIKEKNVQKFRRINKEYHREAKRGNNFWGSILFFWLWLNILN